MRVRDPAEGRPSYEKSGQTHWDGRKSETNGASCWEGIIAENDLMVSNGRGGKLSICFVCLFVLLYYQMKQLWDRCIYWIEITQLMNYKLFFKKTEAICDNGWQMCLPKN